MQGKWRRSKSTLYNSVLFLLIILFPGCSRAVQLDKIKLPPGFSIAIYADNISGARSMTISPKGTLFVGTRSKDKVYAVLDKDGNNRADQVLVIADGLNMPNVVAFRDGDLYVAEVNRIVLFKNIEKRLDNPFDDHTFVPDRVRLRRDGAELGEHEQWQRYCTDLHQPPSGRQRRRLFGRGG